MFRSKKPKSSSDVCHAYKFRFCTDASPDTQYSHNIKTQLPKVNVERAIHHGLVMDGWGFGQNQ